MGSAADAGSQNDANDIEGGMFSGFRRSEGTDGADGLLAHRNTGTSATPLCSRLTEQIGIAPTGSMAQRPRQPSIADDMASAGEKRKSPRNR